jgi:hypothetical protein
VISLGNFVKKSFFGFKLATSADLCIFERRLMLALEANERDPPIRSIAPLDPAARLIDCLSVDSLVSKSHFDENFSK